MARSVKFWRSVAERLVCAECGASNWRIARMNYETRGEGECRNCGAEMTYYKRSRSQPNAVTGAVEPDSLASQIEVMA
jgi:hypothetical protein